MLSVMQFTIKSFRDILEKNNIVRTVCCTLANSFNFSKKVFSSLVILDNCVEAGRGTPPKAPVILRAPAEPPAERYRVVAEAA